MYKDVYRGIEKKFPIFYKNKGDKDYDYHYEIWRH